MNENNRNEQNMQSNEENIQPLFMDDFNEAVIKEPEIIIEKQESQLSDESFINSSMNSEVSTLDVTSNQEEVIVSNNIEQVKSEGEEEKKTKEKNNNWGFIILLFAIVGISVLLFPIFVKIFGY